MNRLIENFQKNTADFLDALALFPDRARTIAPDGEWSAAFIVHHVADGELHFAARYLHTLGSDNPTMIYFEEERYPLALHYDQRSVVKSLASIAGIRAMIFEILSGIEEGAWSRITTSQDGTVFTLAQLVEKANNHLVSHIEQLKALAAQI